MFKKDLTLWLIGVSCFLLLLDYFSLLKFVKSPVEQLITPVKQKVFSTKMLAVDFSQVLFVYPQVSKLASEVQNLRQKNIELNWKLDLTIEENTKLRSQLEAPLPSSYHFIPAQVISVSRFMELGVGEKDGVASGMAVVEGTVFLGKIVAVSLLQSKVILPNDSEITIAAHTSRGTQGTVVGQYGQSVLLDKVVQKDPLFLDDQVVTSGADGLPPNLIIGKIVHISVDDASVYKRAKIEPIIDYQKEKGVFVVSSL